MTLDINFKGLYLPMCFFLFNILLTIVALQITEFRIPELYLTGSDAPYSRFGTSIMAIGDINKDGFIGKPFRLIVELP